ncbi:Crp/Fnr family transcriptional regulator [Mesorhizobium japonicum]|uniref:Cyclic nucleotide-binding protein n=4 Tax=Mesorhizobium TaxID=68287 RepID=A0A1A5HPK2_RHILI|nr:MULTISPECIES: Crp/Fnr family transcriptional regulator [Mesorhizobium]MBE1710669.1 Crp/Fnr family transcriptional regulator [Mesorhizobium japonicum]MBE1715531.1 Crp/Fnr family transcriptional regulator [Mesorhizobium japonicum]MUT23250.1 helix-turn-helix domain-containing protein [Mesorhizobium japonicum]MUT29983.1 helix-turn-helix domain-containing protein [Mesorhizobium japonicum]OBP68562.1 cyclic nucleotide-binding protein [Mesorhizobium loti]
MSDPTRDGSPQYRNELLRFMPADDLALLAPHMQRCALPVRMMLVTPNIPIEAVYFIEQGIGSVVASTASGHDAEIGFIGFEGMTGSALVMGDDRAAHACFVQLEGEAIRIDAAPFNAALAASPTLRLFLLRFVNTLHTQTGCTALVNARLKLEERLARWLLMCDDRVPGESLAMTHEFLSIMLGVRRPGVTVALQLLEGRALIRSRRGEIVIRDRAGLLELANGGYGQAEAEYARLIGEIMPG